MSLLDQAQSDRLLIPVEVPGGDPALALLERIASAVEGTGRASASASQQTAAAESIWRRTADTFNEVRQAATSIIGDINAVAEHLVTGASEAQRMARATAQLGLDFDRAADGAGGYVDKLEVMTAAQGFAERGIRLTQTELNALSRVSQDYARQTGREFREVVQQLGEGIAKGGEELGRFGPELARTSATTHTAGERLRVLVEHAQQISPAARTAEESMRAFEGALRDADRTFSQGFVETLASFQSNVTDSASAVRDLRGEIYAIGATTAEVVARAGAGIQILVGGLITGIGGVVGGLRAAGAGIAALIERRDVAAAARAEFSDAMTTGFMGDVVRRVGEQIDRLEAMDAGRTSMEAPSVGADRATQARDAAARQQRQGGGTRRGRGADMTFTMEDAYDSTGSAGAQSREATARFREGLRRTTEGRASEERGVDALLSSERQRDEGAATKDRAAAVRAETALLDRQAARERQRFEERLEAQRSFTDRWEEMHHRQISASEELANTLNTAFTAVGDALAKHIEAVIAGQETVGEALQNILADVLTTLGKEALVKGAFYTAEALAAIVRYDFPGAAVAGATAAAYFGVGALALAGGSALQTQPAASGGHASGGGSSGGSDKVLSSKSGNDNAAPPQVVNHYYAPVIGGRDATAAEVGARMNRYTGATAERQTRERAA
mgnify:CR=1 FL=1